MEVVVKTHTPIETQLSSDAYNTAKDGHILRRERHWMWHTKTNENEAAGAGPAHDRATTHYCRCRQSAGVSNDLRGR